jgi:predicted NAD-dependent protein-ADP-ribosyltransferase YbiA (DUF1768 family)
MKLHAANVDGRLAAFGVFLFLVVAGSSARESQCSSQSASPSPPQISRDSRYPAHWWTPAPKEGAPSWEILPQEAGPGEVILSKRNELGLLSNFAATPFVYEGKRYASLEGFWQMMKYPEGPDDQRAKFPGLEWKYTREQVAQLTSFEAKAAGTLADQNLKKMGITWVTFAGKQFEYKIEKPGEHYRLIVAATWEKVRQNPEVRKVLLATGDLILKPDHHQEPNPPPAWRYYEILTQIRAELQEDQQSSESPPLLRFADLQKNDAIDGPFKIVGLVTDIYKCPPCPAGAMCKPCIGDHIDVTDNLDEKNPALIKRLRIYTDKPEQFEAKKKYLFTVKVRGKILKGQPIHDVDLVSFAGIPD